MTAATVPVDPASEALAQRLRAIATRVAQRQGKVVELRAHGLELLPAADRGPASDIAVQLIRNAIVHGIERPQERRAAGKADIGAIVVDVVPNIAYGVTLSVHDDGRGIDISLVRARLAASGRFSPERLAALSDREVAARIFDPGFSTRSEDVDEDAGHGVGLDVVQRLAAGLGGQVQVQSRPGRGTSFRLVLSTPVMLAAIEPPAGAVAAGGAGLDRATPRVAAGLKAPATAVTA